MNLILVIFLYLVGGISTYEISNYSFPDSFLIGVGSSSYQIEGAWNESGKGENNWDFLVHTSPGIIADGSNGDVACDSYHLYKEDIALISGVKAKFYRFSISWSRILPSGFVNKVNQAGVDYYNNLIDGLLAEGIEPWITMFHWDLPQSINNIGAFNNPEIIQYFLEYADLLFSLYGDRVKTWFTINEPISFCANYPDALAIYYGQTKAIGVMEYLCAQNVLKAHAKVYHLYRWKYWLSQQGRVSLVVSIDFMLPGTTSAADIKAAERKNSFYFGWFLHPLVHGNYPQVMIDYVANISALQGFPSSRLPPLSLVELLEIKGAYDFLAINHYTTSLAIDDTTFYNLPLYEYDDGVTNYKNASWLNTSLSWLTVVPEGFRDMLVYLKNNYNNPEIIITEGGFGDTTGDLNDTDRIDYLKTYWSAGLRAIHEDKVRLTGYAVWSILDNFEWASGFTVKFGIVQVDFNSPNRTRTPKSSYSFVRKVIETKCLVDTCE